MANFAEFREFGKIPQVSRRFREFHKMHASIAVCSRTSSNFAKKSGSDVGISFSRAEFDYVVKSILPCLLTDSIRAWALPASAKGKVLKVVARNGLVPLANSGHTAFRKSAATSDLN